ncbi:hypothetical protein [Amycolatopsis taiwanensis]|uniref:hypothetical protein n=1 Tax=Amycolatopsis taiwanensis TaxID=342230 RepID=UPI0004829573|nr:hypothetical protein [Amycolatopsis taiwanensis]
MAGLNPLENLRVAMQELEDSRRVVICSPEWESRVKTMIDAYGIGGLWSVQVNRFIGDDKLVIVDPNAMEAAHRQAMQRAARDFRFDPNPPPHAAHNGGWLRRWMT